MHKILFIIFLITNIYATQQTHSVCNGHGEIKYTNATYVGECSNNKREGQGVLRFENTESYEGSWKMDKRNGQGRYTYANGMVYDGNWVDDTKEGKATLTYPDGSIYTGEFHKDKLTGKGKFIYASGDIYEGSFLNSKREGQGVLIYVDGARYEGAWHNDNKNGYGKQTYPSGAYYEGDWVNNAKDGKGIYVDRTGSKYEGAFKNNQRNGYGVLTYANKRVYEGNWLNDLREGKGKILYQDGKIFFGSWHKDKKEGIGSELTQYGLCKGIWKDSKLIEVTNEISTKEAYQYFNTLRQQAGMIALKPNKILQKSAKSHSRYIELHHKSIKGLQLHHEVRGKKGFTGKTPSDRAIAQGYFSNNIGEGISNFCTAKESINSLMTAIYHRFGVLSFSKDEVGIGFTNDPKILDRNFVHNMGSSRLNQLCQGSSAWIGYYYEKVCADPKFKVKKEPYDKAKASIRGQNPEYVLWPSANSKNNLYYFQNEIPNPMPGFAKTGNPISVEFNPYYFSKKVMMHSFKLFKNNKEIKNNKILTKKTDPNKKFTRLQYALFPLDVLARNAVYNVEFKYSYNGSIDTIKWTFTTMK